MTKVSIGLPVYNGDRYLEGALSTLVDQTHTDLEIVISDNASTDRTQAICEEFARRDPRIRYIRQTYNKGAAFNHNTVAYASTGEYFRWYSYDDRMGPRLIEECAKVLDENPDVVLAWPRPSVIDADGNVIDDFTVDLPWDNRTPSSRLGSRVGPNESQVGWCFPIYGLARRSAFLECLPMGAFNRSDVVVLAHLALLGQWRELPQGLFFCRVHADNSTARRAPHEMACWMDPKASPARSMPNIHAFTGYLKAVTGTAMSAGEKARSLALVARWPFIHGHWRLLVWDARMLAWSAVAARHSRANRSTVLGETNPSA
jgi:hypothetical protein